MASYNLEAAEAAIGRSKARSNAGSQAGSKGPYRASTVLCARFAEGEVQAGSAASGSRGSGIVADVNCSASESWKWIKWLCPY